MKLNKDNFMEESTFKVGEKIHKFQDKDGTFIGDVYLNMIDDGNKKYPLLGNVTFANESRSNWHVHNAEQGILGIEGEGLLVLETGKVYHLKRGDYVTIPAGVRHWHGAEKDSYFIQLVVMYDGDTSWEQPVNDEEYKKAIE